MYSITTENLTQSRAEEKEDGRPWGRGRSASHSLWTRAATSTPPSVSVCRPALQVSALPAPMTTRACSLKLISLYTHMLFVLFCWKTLTQVPRKNWVWENSHWNPETPFHSSPGFGPSAPPPSSPLPSLLGPLLSSCSVSETDLCPVSSKT